VRTTTLNHRKKKTRSQQDPSQTHTMGLVGPGRDLPQTLPILNRLKIRFNAQKPISNAQKLIFNISKLIFYLKLKPRG
jgi:hypothetical protein